MTTNYIDEYIREVTSTEMAYEKPLERLATIENIKELKAITERVQEDNLDLVSLKRRIFYGKDKKPAEPAALREIVPYKCLVEEKIPGNTSLARLLHASLGLMDEAAEFQNALNNSLFFGEKLDTVNLKEELGDILWYLTVALAELDLSYEEVMKTNLEKLRKRYGAKFSEEKAINRNTEEERKILESSL